MMNYVVSQVLVLIIVNRSDTPTRLSDGSKNASRLAYRFDQDVGLTPIPWLGRTASATTHMIDS